MFYLYFITQVFAQEITCEEQILYLDFDGDGFGGMSASEISICQGTDLEGNWSAFN